MPSLDDLLTQRPPTAERPLLGLTVLLVEDSRFACEAMRLMCLKSGARLRRAGSLLHARRHLATYRPGLVVIDLGLPDGDGCSLIRELCQATPSVGAILATSGDPDGEARSIEAGAHGFMPKPITSLAKFQSTILAHLPQDRMPPGPRIIPDDEISPDPIALRDDLAHIANILRQNANEDELDYAAQFLTGVARCAGDTRLEKAAMAMAGSHDEARLDDLNQVTQMLKRRLAARDDNTMQLRA